MRRRAPRRGAVRALLGACVVVATSGWGTAQPDGCPPAAADPAAQALLAIEGALPDAASVLAKGPDRTLLERVRAGDDEVDLLAVASAAYGVAVPPGTPDVDAWRAWTDVAAEAVTAYAVLLEAAPGEVVAQGTYWASPWLERLTVRRLDAPPDDPYAPEAWAALGSCRVTPDGWIAVPAATLRDVAGNAPERYAYLAPEGPDGRDLPGVWIDAADLPDAVRFDHPAVRDADRFHAWFAGPPLPFLVWASVVPQVRSSVDPDALLTTVLEIAGF
ncbi:MAG: hypothetical protein RI554_00665 [Trueperaceae bacterium]|nr:hypothetical protein [Trueperaceae bacterium]